MKKVRFKQDYMTFRKGEIAEVNDKFYELYKDKGIFRDCKWSDYKNNQVPSEIKRVRMVPKKPRFINAKVHDFQQENKVSRVGHKKGAWYLMGQNNCNSRTNRERRRLEKLQKEQEQQEKEQE